MIRKDHVQEEVPTWIGVLKDWQTVTANPLPVLVSLEPAHLRTHALVIGSTGSGKTNLIHHLIAQDLERRHSVVVLDLRGDLADAVCAMCRGHVAPEQVKFLDLREKERPLGFDPLSGPGEPYFRALGVLSAIAFESESWGVQLAETLRNALMLLAEAGKRLTDLEHLLHDRAFRTSCLAGVAPSPVTEFWQRFDALSEDRQQTLAMPVLNKVSLLFATKTLCTILSHPQPLDLALHLNRPGSVILVSLAVDEMHQAGRMLGNLFLSGLCREVLSRVRTPEALRNPVHLFVDEFENFTVPDFETILAEGRRFGLSLVLAHQTLAQLTPRLRSMVLNNVGVKLCFRCGREDSATLAKDILGDAKSVDLAGLATGEAFMWVRGFGMGLIEVNEPIPAAKQWSGASEHYLNTIRALNGDPADEGFRTNEAGNAQPRSQRHRSPKPGSGLEDWLGG